MARNKVQSLIGLDIGSYSVKGIELELNAQKQLRIVTSQVINTQTEGIIGDKELHGSIKDWITKNSWTNKEFAVGIPQDLTTTQLSDFPPGAEENLAGMVSYETNQLSGISDEKFIHDFQQMKPNYGRKNPALIGICRETVIRDKKVEMEECGVSFTELSMTGIALSNAFFSLHPEIVNDDSLQLLLDIGEDTSTLVIIAEGQTYFISSIFFGSRQYSEAIASHLQVSHEEAEKSKIISQLNYNETESPLFMTTQRLEYELQNSIEQWRSQEKPGLSKSMFSNIWLSGGGSLLSGLDKFLAQAFGCTVERFGPTLPTTGEIAPQLVTAYGLAIQGLGLGHVKISLCPQDILWQIKRQKRFKYLLAATALLSLLIGITFLVSYLSTNKELNVLTAENNVLRKCKTQKTTLENIITKIRYHETRVMPLVERGLNVSRYITLINSMKLAINDTDWLIYLGDEEIFYESKKKDKKDKSNNSSAIGTSLLGGGTKAVAEEASDYQKQYILPDMPTNKSFIVTGYTIGLSGPIAIREKLEKLPIYKGNSEERINTLKPKQLEHRKKDYQTWTEPVAPFLSKDSSKRLRRFTLQIPVTNSPLNVLSKKETDKK